MDLRVEFEKPPEHVSYWHSPTSPAEDLTTAAVHRGQAGTMSEFVEPCRAGPGAAVPHHTSDEDAKSGASRSADIHEIVDIMTCAAPVRFRSTSGFRHLCNTYNRQVRETPPRKRLPCLRVDACYRGETNDSHD